MIRSPSLATPRDEAAVAPRAAAPRLLVADDQVDVLEALRLLLRGEGFELDLVDGEKVAPARNDG